MKLNHLCAAVAALLTSLSASAVGVAVAAVPEPETYSLILGGLALMGWVAHHRWPRD